MLKIMKLVGRSPLGEKTIQTEGGSKMIKCCTADFSMGFDSFRAQVDGRLAEQIQSLPLNEDYELIVNIRMVSFSSNGEQRVFNAIDLWRITKL